MRGLRKIFARRARRVGAGVLGVTLIAAIGFVWQIVPPSDEAAARYPGGASVYSADGALMRVELGRPDETDCRPTYTVDRADRIVQAIVAAEDGTFWTHAGVRPLSVLRALRQNLTMGRRVSGASTLTMQVVRLIEPHPKSYFEKALEAVRAYKLERRHTKEWILAQYLNRVPFGSNFVGIEAAAQGWFGKSAKELGIGEAACLAGMVQAPSRYRPDRHPARALARREYVLERMVKLGYITEAQRQDARSVVPTINRAPRPNRHPFFCDWYLKARRGDRGTNETHAVRYVTTLDEALQGRAECLVAEAATASGASAAAIIWRVADDSPIALAVSGDYWKDPSGQFNTATAPRPAGSTLKPFLTALALDAGFVTPASRLEDRPYVAAGYRPANFEGTYRGTVSLKEALVLSLNLPFVHLLGRLGVDRFKTKLESFGFGHLARRGENLGLGLAIGNAEVSLMELCRAYGVLARGGETQAGTRLCSPGAAYVVADILSGDARSGAAFGHIADVKVPRFAWKTGTSAAYRDAWTIAWNPQYVVGVWVGHKTGCFGDQSIVGIKAAAPSCLTLARMLYPKAKGPWFERPKEVVAREVCAVTGAVPRPDCVARETDWMIKDHTWSLTCTKNHAANEVEPLRIIRPEPNARFRPVPLSIPQRVACRASGQGSTGHLWWFVDDGYVGETIGSEVLAIDYTPGPHRLTCVDPNGRTASTTYTIE